MPMLTRGVAPIALLDMGIEIGVFISI